MEQCKHDLVEKIGELEQCAYTQKMLETKQTYHWYNCVDCHTTLLRPKEYYVPLTGNFFEYLASERRQERLRTEQKRRLQDEK